MSDNKNLIQLYIGKGLLEIELQEDTVLKLPETIQLFSEPYDGVKPALNHRYFLTISDELKRNNPLRSGFLERFPDAKQILRKDLEILDAGELEYREFYFEGSDTPYGVSMDRSETETDICVSDSVLSMFGFEVIFLSLFSLEKRMIAFNGLILHCAYIERHGKAILFSAPSETGKSTQADLWEKYRGTRTINGDCSLIYEEENVWYAHGWPICGSSGICHNETFPVNAIVMLYQNPVNVCRRLKGAEIYRKLYPQIKVNMWNEKFQNRVFDQLDRLIATVPVFELGCNISEDAVRCLEESIVTLDESHF